MTVTSNIHHVGDVETTMNTAREMLPDANGAPFGVLAESQSKGKATGGRTWLSPKGNMYFTFGVPQKMIPAELLPVMPLVTGLATRAAVAAIIPGAVVHLKWPNDIIFDAKKIGGSIVEHEGEYLLFGVGLNMDSAPPIADDGRAPGTVNAIAESLEKPKANPAAAAEAVWQIFFELIADPKLTRAAVVQRFDAAMDKSLTLHRRRGTTGRDPEELTAVKLNEWGHLIVQNKAGIQDTLSAEYLL